MKPIKKWMENALISCASNIKIKKIRLLNYNAVAGELVNSLKLNFGNVKLGKINLKLKV